MAVGRCLEPSCPAGQVEMRFTEGRNKEAVPLEISQFVCPACETRLRVGRVDIQVVSDGGNGD